MDDPLIKSAKKVSGMKDIPGELHAGKFSKLKKEFLKNKPKLFKPMLFLLFSALVLSLAVYAYIYIKTVTSPDYILNKSIASFMENKKVKYEADAKLFFSYGGRDESAGNGALQEYQNLRRSSSDTYEIKLTGNIDRSTNPPEGKYELSWSKPEEKLFGFDGYISGYDLFYKANYSYQGVLPDKLKEEYSKINLKDLLSASAIGTHSTDELGESLKAIKYSVTEEFPNDLLEGKNSYHYKVNVTLPESLSADFKNLRINDLNIWIDKKSLFPMKVSGSMEIINVGVDGNEMTVNLELKLIPD